VDPVSNDRWHAADSAHKRFLAADDAMFFGAWINLPLFLECVPLSRLWQSIYREEANTVQRLRFMLYALGLKTADSGQTPASSFW
jgi:hypothetical protein